MPRCFPEKWRGYWSYHAAPTQRMRRGWPAEH
nr:MAG TPA_asm: hypothetical protein [Caudoviricetes sp.]